jgi:hypothetical protein
MARTALTVQQVTRSALTPVLSAANGSGGHSVANDGATWLEVKTTTNAIVVTVQTPGTVDGNAVADKTYSIGTSAERKIGPFPPNVYNQADGAIYVDLDVVTGVTIGAFRAT